MHREKRQNKRQKIELPDAIKLRVVTDKFKTVILELGIDPAKKSLDELTQEAVSRAKVARVISEQMASTQAFIDGAQDSIRYGTPADLKRAQLQLDKAQKNLLIGLAALQADANRHGAPVAPPAPPAEAPDTQKT